MERPLTPASAPARLQSRPGHDALSFVLGVEADSDVADTVRTVLKKSPEPVNVFKLAKQTGVSFIDLSAALHDLHEHGDIKFVGEPGNEAVQLS